MKQITSQDIVKGFQAREHRYSFLKQEVNTYPWALHLSISFTNLDVATMWVPANFKTPCKLNLVSS